ncbi:uncharacterized protein CcaverHIS019_0703920 [Cutaneotrichosporon cavernicola]|uniref:UBC core domain-containing protein n=1 Tax=Cutaneotrichosporon cavernicola TaxID=279322 RepID=A0AA48LAD9_9TREE|nr:uncharacterized protein CcaverHIS019_0703920 [Cutaneotrichosporon cavernicola]BEI94811.1 hypothetical protein CcaverHIS019_0703920 [Cutaneotrichosporon cavernicola]
MADARLRRVQKEIKACQADKHSQISIQMVEDNPFHLIGSFPGPGDTPYEGGYYEIDIVIPDGYPFEAVKMKFITKVYRESRVKDEGRDLPRHLEGQVVLTLKSTLISLQSLLCSPEPNDPQDAEVAKHFLSSRESFNATARHWAQTYAQPTAKRPIGTATDAELAGLTEASVRKFTDMGFERKTVIATLKRLNYRGNNITNINENTVVEALLK